MIDLASLAAARFTPREGDGVGSGSAHPLYLRTPAGLWGRDGGLHAPLVDLPGA